jgi:hypothetical protein
MTSKTNSDPAAQSSSDQETTFPSVKNHQSQEPSESLVRGSVDLYDRDGLHIWADLNAKGALVISGQDLRPPFGWDEYEYSFAPQNGSSCCYAHSPSGSSVRRTNSSPRSLERRRSPMSPVGDRHCPHVWPGCARTCSSIADLASPGAQLAGPSSTAAKYSNASDFDRSLLPSNAQIRAQTRLVDRHAPSSQRGGQGFESPQLHRDNRRSKALSRTGMRAFAMSAGKVPQQRTAVAGRQMHTGSVTSDERGFD